MSFTLVLLPPAVAGWAGALVRAVPGIEVLVPRTDGEAAAALRDADAAVGALPPDLLARARRLRWLQAPQAGPPPGFYHPALVAHPVVVTNMRDTYTDHVAAHTVALVLALARELPRYARDQRAGRWAPDWAGVLPLTGAAALVVGTGAIGAETGRLLAQFGMRVAGVDARRTEPPPGFTTLGPPAALDHLLPGADVVVLTVPHTPATEGLIDARRLALFRPSAYLVNVGRGATVRLADLVAALDAGRLRGAALDVLETEPLPPGHPLWSRDDVLVTPHVAGAGPDGDERRLAVLVENARRFAAGRELMHVVDKSTWY
ncbi:D-2-hydroxyacid dehydrogenase [Spirilliplanes yamanashiensis]|uniref:2-hydroxyacid dehydrogenase n=1 Tax=Spirilliplanes yamanashiensis TaxID=42233 RepID=A0A8J4DLS6_9ACTN|nr:D-2-hydroxyacid dehydrogenase [Spirilliplanes yamanashiensis]MDP9819095.1 phosphoglycerate dehydrogenase-like enzyme [Spirilliplanes yamanashiensis]GIJ05549.1 2-hydroxyacid dehydrogenase [Spirilliplanes yamanashiensis]